MFGHMDILLSYHHFLIKKKFKRTTRFFLGNIIIVAVGSKPEVGKLSFFYVALTEQLTAATSGKDLFWLTHPEWLTSLGGTSTAEFLWRENVAGAPHIVTDHIAKREARHRGGGSC